MNAMSAQTKQRFEAWWQGQLTESPLLSLVSLSREPGEPHVPAVTTDEYEDERLNVRARVADFVHEMRSHTYLADAYPNLSLDLGPGSLALYLGSDPVFRPDTVWFSEVVENSWRDYPLVYDAHNRWWNTHVQMLRDAQAASGGAFYVNIPDIVENIDILAAMRGPQQTCYDLMDDPDIVAERIRDLDLLYFTYFDAMYDVVKDDSGGSSYTAFQIWGPGKTAKLQCDFCAMMSPGQFSELIVPSLAKQCAKLTHSMYHLDGKDAVRHVPALMSIDQLDALQWTPGAGQPDGGAECWYPIYDQVRDAGKSLWVVVEQGDATVITDKIRKLVRRYGTRALYVIVPPRMKPDDADTIMRAYAHGFR